MNIVYLYVAGQPVCIYPYNKCSCSLFYTLESMTNDKQKQYNPLMLMYRDMNRHVSKVLQLVENSDFILRV